jgi:hypothetical protein
MRATWIIGLAACASIAGAPAVSTTLPGAPNDLAVSFFNAIPDVCYQVARGHTPTRENAGALRLEPTSDVPATFKDHFGQLTNWFRLKSEPANIFVGLGDRPNACHVVLANTTQTDEMQKKLIAFLKSGGFELLQASPRSSPFNEMLFVREVPDGYMQVSLQAPRNAIRDGAGDQGVVHVNLVPKAVFEAMLSKP